MAKKRTQNMVVQQSGQVSEVESSKKLTPEEVTPQGAQSQESDHNDQVYEAEETKKEVSTKAKRKKGRSGQEEYQIYVYRVLKQVHPDMGISSKAMTILNNLMNDMFERLANEAARLNKHTGQITLSPRDIQGAVKLVFPGELGKHALAEGAKAVTTYFSNHT